MPQWRCRVISMRWAAAVGRPRCDVCRRTYYGAVLDIVVPVKALGFGVLVRLISVSVDCEHMYTCMCRLVEPTRMSNALIV